MTEIPDVTSPPQGRDRYKEVFVNKHNMSSSSSDETPATKKRKATASPSTHSTEGATTPTTTHSTEGTTTPTTTEDSTTAALDKFLAKKDGKKMKQAKLVFK